MGFLWFAMVVAVVSLLFYFGERKRRKKLAKSHKARWADAPEERKAPKSSDTRLGLLTAPPQPSFQEHRAEILAALMGGLNVRRLASDSLEFAQCHSIAQSMFAWRGGTDGPSNLSQAERMGALLRDMAHDCDQTGHIAKADVDHGLAALSDAEIVSLFKLWQYGGPNKGAATGVTSMAPFEELDRVKSDFESKRAKIQAAFETWKKKTGGPDADHLFANGIFEFVSKSGVKDIAFWHSLATDFHDMFGDHLDAVFWILEQPECDRATAWHFIVGFVSWECLLKELRFSKGPKSPTAHDERKMARSAHVLRMFEAVIRRWNDGFYRHHSLVPNLQGGEGFHGFSNEDINCALSKAEEQHDLPKMLRPTGLDVDLSQPKDDMSRSIATHLDWIEGVGLQLSGGDWFKPEWHPDRFE